MSRTSKTKRQIWAADQDRIRTKRDSVATEEPLEILLRAGNEERTIAITMRTPGNDYELVAGFLHAEDVIQHKQEIDRMTYCVDGRLGQQEYNLLRVQLASAQLPDIHQLDRHFFTSSACGVCGRTILDELEKRDLPTLSTGPQIGMNLIHTLPEKLRTGQILFETTGGLHAASLFSPQGELLQVREDVGRHNALDKLIGWGLLNQKLPFSEHIIMVSGRASYELLQKCRVAGVSIFCAVSAPSSLAVDLAKQFGVTLIGFLRDQRFNIYATPQRVIEFKNGGS